MSVTVDRAMLLRLAQWMAENSDAYPDAPVTLRYRDGHVEAELGTPSIAPCRINLGPKPSLDLPFGDLFMLPFGQSTALEGKDQG